MPHARWITSQVPTKNWHEILADPTIADAICDRWSTTPTSSDSRAHQVAKRKDSRSSRPNLLLREPPGSTGIRTVAQSSAKRVVVVADSFDPQKALRISADGRAHQVEHEAYTQADLLFSAAGRSIANHAVLQRRSQYLEFL